MSDVVITPEDPTACIILLHGCNEEAWAYRQLAADVALPHVKWVIPQAASRPVTMLGGQSVPAWFDVGPTEDVAGVKRAAEEVDALISEQVAAGIPEEKIVLGGFSMGAATALYAMLARQRNLAGYFSLSGWVPAQSELEGKDTAKVALFFGHGNDDDIIDEDELKMSLTCLVKCGVAPTCLRRYQRMGHEVGTEEKKDLAKWLAKTLR